MTRGLEPPLVVFAEALGGASLDPCETPELEIVCDGLVSGAQEQGLNTSFHLRPLAVGVA